jgi:hypothetical protein
VLRALEVLHLGCHPLRYISHRCRLLPRGSGRFDGYAWAENIGWIHFRNASPAYDVRTSLFDGVPLPGGAMFELR